MSHDKNCPYVIAISGKTGAGKSTLSQMMANQLNATLISWDDYDDLSREPDNFILWHQSGRDYAAFQRQALSKNLADLKSRKETVHPVFNRVLPITQFIIFDAPLGRLHQQTGRFIDMMIHIETPLDVLLCRRLLRDFNNQTNTKDLLEEVKFYLEQSRPLYFDKELKETADLVIDGMLPTEQELICVMNYVTNHITSQVMISPTDPKNKIEIRRIRADDPQLSEVIQFSIGNPSCDKVREVIKSYHNSDYEIMGAFMQSILIGIAGLCKTDEAITLMHVSVLPQFQRKGIGTVLLNDIKKRYIGHSIFVETDEEAVKFYLKSDFICNTFKNKYGKLRYKCEFVKNNYTYF
jgi:uridine kinase